MKFTIGPLVPGLGLALLIAGVILLIIGLVLLTKLLRTDWNMSVSAFNAKFAYESSLGQSDMQLDTQRRETAKRLGIYPTVTTEPKNVGIRVNETAILNTDPADDRTEEL